ncbi:unnamed protein product [Lactuca saligna]|uniref:Protein kinase domain-containing protein n=1 Tax=Lactuca saligna TaxID=75948 RepID=A0AA35V1U8_LACSI|nr:unnamed protein product [Lactuca saligna]
MRNNYRLVRCPCCWKFQQDPGVPIYVCGGCNAILIVIKDENERVSDHDTEILVAHMDFAKKAEIYTHDILPLDLESSDDTLLKQSEVNTKLGLVRCPRCQKVLLEPPEVLVYGCGGCNSILLVKEKNDRVDREVNATEILEAQVAQRAAMYTQSIPPPDPESTSDQTLITTHPKPNNLKIPLEAIKDCTQDFNQRNFIGKGGYGKVYKGLLFWADHVNQLVAVKRLDVTGFQGNKEFHTELTMLSQYHHENIIRLIGFCDDNKEMILVYEYASNGSLDTYLRDTSISVRPSWTQLLKICIDVASALDYLHNHVAEKHRIIHRDIKAANVLLDENWNAKLADFGLSRIGLANQPNTFVITNLAGTYGYCDPQYEKTGFLTKESDVYSFGVVLFEVLCGRLACDFSYNDERRFLHHLVRASYKSGDIDKIIDPKIRKDIKPSTLLKFSAISSQCLEKTREKRPAIAEVAFQLKEAMQIQIVTD